jgi:hypothetical protein
MDDLIESSQVERWRTHCQRRGNKLNASGTDLGDDAVDIQRVEDLWIERLCRVDLPLATRAAAFRSLIELRDCTARDLGTFFGIEAAVIIRGLSLLDLPAYCRIDLVRDDTTAAAQETRAKAA